MSAERVIERIRAAIRMAYPDDMTPAAKRLLESILDEESDAVRPPSEGTDGP